MAYTNTYQIERRFRCVTDEMIGQIQVLYLDEGWTHWMIANKFAISEFTSQAICRAIPQHQLRASAKAKESQQRIEERRKHRPQYTEKDKRKMMRRTKASILPPELTPPPTKKKKKRS